MGFALRLVSRFLWVYSFATLAVVLGISAYPGVLMVQAVYRSTTWFGWTPAPAIHLLGLTITVAAAYFVMGLTMMLILPVLRVAMGARTGEGTIPIRSWKVWSWYNYNGLILSWQTLFGRFWRSSSLYVLFLRAMGAKVGHNVIVNSNVVYDHDMLEIGDYTVIGGDAAIIGHVGEKGNLVRQRIRIGKRCTIGQYATIFPGATLGDNCHVGAMSLVPKGAVLDANAVYGGVPARKIKDLSPGEEAPEFQTSDPEALAVEWEKAVDEEELAQIKIRNK